MSGKWNDRTLPPDLRTELEEYTSLLRALRTENTLDLAAHLTEHLREDTRPDDQLHGRDQWTRWPLPDAPRSIWDLEDEIGVILRRQLSGKRGLEEGSDLDNAEEDYVGELVSYLTPILVNFVENILVLVEAHTFPRPPSLQDRINPLDWRDLANILASPEAKNLIDARMLERYVNRMEALFGSTRRWQDPKEPCPRRAIDRRHIFDRQRARRQELYDLLMSSLLR